MYCRTAAGSSGGVIDDRDAAERADHFGEHSPVQRHAGHRKARGKWRMRVNDRLRVRPLPVDLEVHEQLGRGLAIARDLLSIQIHDHHHVGRHEALRHALRGRQHAVVGEADADVAVVAGTETPRVEPTPDFDDVGAETIEDEIRQELRPFRSARRAGTR
jgi:hypothetical protein